MQESTTREKVLKKIRNAIISQTANPYPNLDFDSPVFRMNDDVPELIFAQAFREAGGNFVFCENMLEFAEGLLNLAQSRKWKQLLCVDPKVADFLDQCEFPVTRNAEDVVHAAASVTGCECLIARTGSIMVSSAQPSGRVIPAYSTIQIVVAYSNQIVDDLKDGFNYIKNKYQDKAPSSLTFVTGPSRTADIGNETVIGAQGPSEVFLFLVDNPDM